MLKVAAKCDLVVKDECNSRRRIKDCRTLSKIPSIVCILSSTRSSVLSTYDPYTSSFMLPHKKASSELRSGECEGYATGPQQLFHQVEYVAFRMCRAAVKWWYGAPSCMNHMFVSAVSGSDCNKQISTCFRKT